MQSKFGSDVTVFDLGNEIQLTGAVYSGKGRHFLLPFPGETIDSTLQNVCLSQDEWERFIRQTDLLEVEVLAKATDGQLVKAVLRKSQRQIDQGASWIVFRRDGFKCRYCGVDNQPLTVDHVVLWEDGGPSIPENLVSACRKCNRTRGNMKYADWLLTEYYRVKSRDLTQETKDKNLALLNAIPRIPIKKHIASR